MQNVKKLLIQFSFILIPTLVSCLYLLGVFIVYPNQNFPLNDDWVYTLNLLNTVNLGAISLTGLEMAWGIPQVILASFLHFSDLDIHIKLRCFGIIVTVFTVFFLHLLLNQKKNLDVKSRLVLLATVVVFPPLFITSLSFMTDNLFFLLLVISLFCYEKAFEKENLPFFIIGLIVTYVGFLQRQVMILQFVPLIIYTFYLQPKNSDKIKRIKWALLVGVGLFVAIFLYTNKVFSEKFHIPTSYENILSHSLLGRIKIIHVFFYFGGLILLPTSLIFPLKIKNCISKRGFFLWSILFTISLIRLLFDKHAPFQGNVISSYGTFDENEIMIGKREIIFPILFRFFALSLGLIGYAKIINQLNFFDYSKYLKEIFINIFKKFLILKIEYIPGVFTIIFAVVYMLAIIYRGVMFDRYFIPMIPAFLFIGSYFVKNRENNARGNNFFYILSLLSFFIFSITITKDYFSWNEAKWEILSNSSVTAHKSAEELDGIDGGYEWNGYIKKALYQAHSAKMSWEQLSYRISFSLPDINQVKLKAVESRDWYSIWPPHNRKIYLIEKNEK